MKTATSDTSVSMHVSLSSKKTALFLLAVFPAWAQTETTDGEIYAYMNSTAIVEEKQTLTRPEIEKLNPSDVPTLLEYLGITIKSSGGYGSESIPSIRGFTGSSIKILINGIEMNSAQSGTFDFSTLDPESIEKIQIVKGAFNQDVQTQGGNGGIIYITTKSEDTQTSLSADISAKSYFSQPVDTITGGIKAGSNISGRTRISAQTSGTFAKNKYPVSEKYFSERKSDLLQQHNKMIDSKTSVMIDHQFENGSSLNISDILFLGNKDLPGSISSREYSNQKDTNNSLSMKYEIPDLNGKYQINSSASWKSTNQKYKSNSEDSLHKLNSFGLSGAVSFDQNDFYSQAIGLTLQVDTLDSTNTEDKHVFSGTLKETSTFFCGERTSIVIPLALNFQDTSISFVPGAGINFDFYSFEIFSNISAMHLFPNMNQLYWEDSAYACGNPDLKPESGIGGELGISTNTIYFPLSFTIFSNYYKNKIQWDNSSGKWRPENVGSAFYIGCDFSVSQEIMQNILFKFNYEFLYNRLLASGITHGNRIMYTPAHTFSASLIGSYKHVSFAINGHYTGARYVSNINSSILEGYFLLDFSAEFNVTSHIIPYIKAQNILNQLYEQTEDYPMPGASLEVGIKLKK